MSAGRSEGRLLAAIGVVLLTLSMRSPTTSLATVYATIDADIGIGLVVLGVIGAIPLFAFAVAGLFTPRVARRWGLEVTVTIASVVIIAGQVIRSLAAEAGLIIAATVLIMLGIGIANVLMPAIIKQHFPRHLAIAGAVYPLFIGASSALPGFFAVPLTAAFGWRPVLAGWALTAVLALLPWLFLARRRDPGLEPVDVAGPGEGFVRARVSRLPAAWAFLLIFIGATSAGFNTAAWLPAMLQDLAGEDPASAGRLLGIMYAVGIPSALLASAASTRARLVPPIILISLCSSVLGWAGLLLAPTAAPALWAMCQGIAGMAFPAMIVQLTRYATDARNASQLSGFVQGIGFLVVGASVLLCGVMNTITEGWSATLVVLITVALLPLPAAWILSKPLARPGGPGPVEFSQPRQADGQ